MLRRLLSHLGSRSSTRRSRPDVSHRIGLERLEDRLVPADLGPIAIDPAMVDPTHLLVRVDPRVGDPRQLSIIAGATFTSPFSLVPGLWEVQLNDTVSVENALAAY